MARDYADGLSADRRFQILCHNGHTVHTICGIGTNVLYLMVSIMLNWNPGGMLTSVDAQCPSQVLGRIDRFGIGLDYVYRIDKQTWGLSLSRPSVHLAQFAGLGHPYYTRSRRSRPLLFSACQVSVLNLKQ
jgi:hypothetical protein